MPSKKYPLPAFLIGKCTEQAYISWISRKAIAHVKRDRKRGNKTATREAYMIAIDKAVRRSNGLDVYTGQKLHWHLISKYKNDASKAGKRAYKAEFARLPTVDHLDDGLGAPKFAICSWRSNDCKNDLSYANLLKFCRAVIAHHEKKRNAGPRGVRPYR